MTPSEFEDLMLNGDPSAPRRNLPSITSNRFATSVNTRSPKVHTQDAAQRVRGLLKGCARKQRLYFGGDPDS